VTPKQRSTQPRPSNLGYTDHRSLRSHGLTVAAVVWGAASVWEWTWDQVLLLR
jgi:hypothetical protein